MKTTPVKRADLQRSVISVPPLALNADFSVNVPENSKIVDWMRAGGVSTFLYGGNANLYNMGVAGFSEVLDALEKIAADDDWMIPSIGPDYGKAMDQISLLKGRDFPTAMILPLAFPTTSAGIATGLRKLADAYGKPVVAYIKSEGFVDPKDLASVLADGVVCSVKYAVVRDDPAKDDYLRALVDACGTERLVSGIGERPAIVHMADFALTGFTSGSVCVAPDLSTAMLHALKAGDITRAEELREAFLPLEDLRDGFSPLTVLHAAVEEAEIAVTGPLIPFLSNLEDAEMLAEIRRAAVALKDANLAARARA